MKKTLIALGIVMATMSSSYALTIPKGHVLGPDGVVYEGASPEQKARLLQIAQEGGSTSGVHGGLLYIIVEGTITFVPIKDLAGKSKDTQIEIVTEAVVETVTAHVKTTHAAQIKETKSVDGKVTETKPVKVGIDGKAEGTNIQEDLTPVKATPVVPKVKKDDIEEAAEEAAEEAEAAVEAAVAEVIAEIVEENVAGAPIAEIVEEAVEEAVENAPLEAAVEEATKVVEENIVENDELEAAVEQAEEAAEENIVLNDELEGPTD